MRMIHWVVTTFLQIEGHFRHLLDSGTDCSGLNGNALLNGSVIGSFDCRAQPLLLRLTGAFLVIPTQILLDCF